jgi:pyruvate,water dikinase
LAIKNIIRRNGMSSEQKNPVKIWDEVPGLELIEKIDLSEMHSWFLAAAYCTPPLTPLFGGQFVNYFSRGMVVAAAELSLPACKGWAARFVNGVYYIAFYIVRDKKEIAKREARGRQALRPWIEDFDGLWGGYKKELLDIYDKLKALDVDNATNVQLYQHNHDLITAYKRMWEIHFLSMYAANNAWLVLDGMTRERFGLKDTDPEFQDMMCGFPNKVYEMDRDMWQFGQLATEMGLKSLFEENDPKSIVAKLQQSEKGKEWFKKFTNYMETDEIGGWRMRRFVDLTEPYWLEDPATPIGLVKDYVVRGISYDLESTRTELARKREAAIAAFLRKVPADEKDLWEGLIRLSGKVSSYSEEHDLYCELMMNSLMRRGYLAMGRRLTQIGTIDQPEDVFMLNPEEINRVMLVPEYHDMRWITRRRKAAWEESLTKPLPPPLITDRASMEDAVGMDLLPSGDPIAIKIVVGELPVVKPELKADIWGLCGCAGEAEGTARVCIVYEDLKNVKPGDILICPGTNPVWTPVFGIVKGVVADTGGTLSHAAIIGREYGVPTITNTMKGTQVIKSGQRIRIDAKNGAVFILDK